MAGLDMERALDLWASLWTADERVAFEAALERVLLADQSRPTRLSAVATCHAIGTERLLRAAAAVGERGDLGAEELAHVAWVTAPIYQRWRRAAQLERSPEVVLFFLRRTLGEAPSELVRGLLERIDIRVLWTLFVELQDGELRRQAASFMASRGPHQRRRLASGLGFSLATLDGLLAHLLAVDVALDDFGAAT